MYYEALIVGRSSFAKQEDRKMCVVVQRHLGKGGPLRASRCIPPGLWRRSGIEPDRANETCSRFIAGQGTGPRHPPVRAFLPRHPAPFRETKDGSFRATLPWSLPLDQPSAVWMPSGAFAPLNPRPAFPTLDPGQGCLLGCAVLNTNAFNRFTLANSVSNGYTTRHERFGIAHSG